MAVAIACMIYLITKIIHLTLYGPNSFLVVFRDITYKMGFFRLPTHRRDAHRKFF